MSDGPTEPQVETPVEATETPEQAPETPQQEESGGGNPAWSPILEVLPSSLHGIVRPKLEEWDKGVQDRFQKIHQQYEPLKPFIERQVDPDRLSQGLRLIDIVDQDPVAFYNHMGERLRAAGYLKEAEQAEAKAEEIEEEQQEQEQGQLEFKDPRLDAFMQQLQEAQEQLEQQKQEEEADRQLEHELTEVQKLHGGPLGEMLEREVLLRAQAMYDLAIQSNRKLPSLVDAYKSQMDFMASYQKQAPKAPQVIPGGGGQPSPQPKDPKQYATDDNARRQAAMSVIQRMHG